MSIVSIRLNLNEPGNDPFKYFLNDSNRLLVIYNKAQIRYLLPAYVHIKSIAKNYQSR